MANEFSERLGEAFDFATMAAIARRLGVPHATVRNYFGGRMPSPEVLIKIARETNVSLNWLLTGTGERFVRYDRPIDLHLERPGQVGAEQGISSEGHDLSHTGQRANHER